MTSLWARIKRALRLALRGYSCASRTRFARFARTRARRARDAPARRGRSRAAATLTYSCVAPPGATHFDTAAVPAAAGPRRAFFARRERAKRATKFFDSL